MTQMNLRQRGERLKEWMRIVAADVSDLLLDRHVYRTVTGMIGRNPDLADAQSHFFFWMFRSYVESSCLAVRRQSDCDPRVVSLRRVLGEFEAFPDLGSFDRYVEAWPNDPLQHRFALLGYKESHGDESGKSLDTNALKRDIETLRTASLSVIDVVDRRIAHYDPRGSGPRPLTLKEIDVAIETVESLATKYYGLIFALSVDLLPTIQYPWAAVFRVPWDSAPLAIK